jgi:hypothetical protein
MPVPPVPISVMTLKSADSDECHLEVDVRQLQPATRPKVRWRGAPRQVGGKFYCVGLRNPEGSISLDNMHFVVHVHPTRTKQPFLLRFPPRNCFGCNKEFSLPKPHVILQHKDDTLLGDETITSRKDMAPPELMESKHDSVFLYTVWLPMTQVSQMVEFTDSWYGVNHSTTVGNRQATSCPASPI